MRDLCEILLVPKWRHVLQIWISRTKLSIRTFGSWVSGSDGCMVPKMYLQPGDWFLYDPQENGLTKRLLSPHFKPNSTRGCNPPPPPPHLAIKKSMSELPTTGVRYLPYPTRAVVSPHTHRHGIDDHADCWLRVVSRRVLPPQSILPKTRPRAVHLQRRFHPGPPHMLHLITTNQPSAPLRGEEGCLISIRVSIPLWGLVVPGH